MHIERSATIRLALPVEQALPLFTPEGECDWVSGWVPEPLHAPDGSLSRKGAVFRTSHGDEETLWMVLEMEPVAGTAEYARITPGSKLGIVRVQCRRDEGEGSFVDVTYELTSLSAAGEATLRALTPEAFDAEIRGWQTAIEAMLDAP